MNKEAAGISRGVARNSPAAFLKYKDGPRRVVIRCF